MCCQEESIEERRLDIPLTSTEQSLVRTFVLDKLCDKNIKEQKKHRKLRNNQFLSQRTVLKEWKQIQNSLKTHNNKTNGRKISE